MIPFIKIYDINANDEEIRKLRLLLNKKFGFDLTDEDLKSIIPFFIKKYEQEKELKIFENDLIYHNEKIFYCCKCKKVISRKEFDYSMNVFNEPLCFTHQDERKATGYAKKIFYALKDRGIECKLEAHDGYKHVDLSIPEAKMYIEIDGYQHSTNPNQLNSDLQRDYHSNINGFVTKRYTNTEIRDHFDDIITALIEVVEKRMKEQ